MKINVTKPLLMGLWGFLIIFSSGAVAEAQGTFVLSKNADFSTQDRMFAREDTLYMKVAAPQVDFTDIDRNEWEVHSENGGDEIEGTFTNHLDGTYTAKVDLSNTNPAEVSWEVRVRIEDDGGNRFESEVQIKIGDEFVEAQILIQGTIESLGAESVVVNGITLQVNNETLVLDETGEPIDFSDLEVGGAVMVLAVRENNELIARSIRLSGAIGEDIRVRGKIQELDDSTLVVVDKEFKVDLNTEILDDEGRPIQFSDLAVGFLVEVRAVIQTDGSLLATRIRIEDEQGEGEVEFTGTIELLNTNTNLIIVDGISFMVTNMTEILDDDNNPISFDALAVGMLVQIRGESNGMGMLVATRIKIEDELEDDEVELRGVVTAVEESSIGVTGVEFQVDGNTVILDEENRPIELADIRVGFVVEVRADVVDGVRVATKIKIKDRFENVIEITGVIEEVGENTLTVAGLQFIVDTQTEIRDEDGRDITFQELEVGLIVEVRAEIFNDGSIVATRIRIEDRFRGQVELVGTIDELGEEFLVVAGVRFRVDADTEILDRDRNPISFSQLNIGLLVEIKGVIENGQIVALRIQVKVSIEDEVKIVGVIEHIEERSITVLDRTFGLTEHTVTFDVEGNTINRSHLFVGQTAEVRGVLLPDGTLVAIRIQVQDDNATQIDVVGPIDSFGANTIEVIGIHFFVDENTEILDVDYNMVGLTDLKVGQTVEVRATGQPNGTRLATRIKVMDVLLLSSVVEGVVFNGIKMLDRQVLFDSSTLILGKLNQFWTVDDLKSGHFVEVRAIRGDDNRLFGTKVKFLGTTSVTSVLPTPDDNGTLPDKFVLHQNYPNPFNPMTTIRFEIPAAGESSVPTKIAIYNILGQEVNVLVNEELAPGAYTVQWHGLNREGRQVPSGVYIYQLKAREVKQTKRMLLIK